jgi:hypothetical protein
MNCRECRESLVSYLEKVPGAPAAEIERHLAECDECRGEAAAVRALRDRMVRLGEAAGAARSIERPVMDRIAQHVRRKQEGKPMMTARQRLFAHPWRLSAASLLFTALLGAAVLLVVRGNRYAFAQTVEAHRNVRSVHVQVEGGTRLNLDPGGAFSYSPEPGAIEMWIEVGEDGKPVRERTDFAWTPDGPKTVFWQDGKASVWFRSKNAFLTTNDAGALSQIPKEFLDPNSLVTALDQRVAAGKAQVSQVKLLYESKRNPKVLVVNPPEPEGTVEVYIIDPETKLLQEMEKYTKHGSKLEFAARYRFTQYNEPIPASIFAPTLPADVMRVNRSDQEVGLAQGKMTDAEASEAVVRQFFECVTAKDYDKAGVLLGGVPADRLRKVIDQIPALKIISIGPAKPDEKSGQKGMFSVPYAVEWNIEGGHRETETGTACVRPVEKQPGHWMLDGGF